jgi:hypothetical protein
MSADSAGTGTLALASPIVAIVGAAFMGCCALAATSCMTTSTYDTAKLLLFAGLPAFGLAQAVALALGIAGLVRVILGRTRGLPEAVLGMLAAFLFTFTALFLLRQAIGVISA